MGKAWVLTAAALLLAAGCAGPAAQQPDEVVVLSGARDEVDEPEPPRPTGKGLGHIAGVVVDERIRPIEGARVVVASLDLVAVTDRTGSFAVADLAPGSYLLRFNATDHEEAQAVVDVKADRFTRTKAILHRILPPEPFVDVMHFRGHVEMTNHGYVYFMTDHHNFQADPRSLHSVVMEASMEPYAGTGLGGENGFYVNLRSQACCNTYHTDSMATPLWTQADGGRVDTEDLRLVVYPWSQPLPETGKTYDVFVSLFYHGPPPAGYSAMGNTG